MNIKSIDLKIIKSPLAINVEEIVQTIQEAKGGKNQSLPFIQRVLEMLPELNSEIPKEYSKEQWEKIITGILKQRFFNESEAINRKINEKKKLITRPILLAVEEMIQIFNMSYTQVQNIECFCGFFNPFPRNILKKEFCVHYDISPEVFIRVCLHEINHMVLFDKWKVMFGYDKESEPHYPEPLWYLQELSIEPTLNIPRIQNIAPYEHKAYDSFYDIWVDGMSLPLQIQHIFDTSSNIEEYLTTAYQYIETHQNSIT